MNLSIEGSGFSRLPRGTTLLAGGAVWEEYNRRVAACRILLLSNIPRGGEPLAGTDFIEASKFCRGLVGVVEVPGSSGDSVTVAPEVLPKWLR